MLEKVSSKVDDGKQGYHTPTNSNCKAGPGKQETRYTPNGTRVPDGTPPSTGEPCPPPQHEPTVVPPFPPSVAHDGDAGLDGRFCGDHRHGGGGGLGGLGGDWTPSRPHGKPGDASADPKLICLGCQARQVHSSLGIGFICAALS